MTGRYFRTPESRGITSPLTSPVRIEPLGRNCVTGPLVFGDQVLLGAIPMEDMDLVIEPARLKVSVNPRAPNIPMSLARGGREEETPRANALVRDDHGAGQTENRSGQPLVVFTFIRPSIKVQSNPMVD
jgi:hypothetical protein